MRDNRWFFGTTSTPTPDLSFGKLIPQLATRRRVIPIEMQGHGHTADVEREVSLEHLANDVVGVLDHLGAARADVVGFSLGGLVALETAVRHPRNIDRLVLASTHVRADGYHDEIRDPAQHAASTRMPPEHFDEMAAEHHRPDRASTQRWPSSPPWSSGKRTARPSSSPW